MASYAYTANSTSPSASANIATDKIRIATSNVGIQYTITNTNASNLTITTTGGTQLIYSSTGAASATSRSLATGHSHIFTAILTTGASTFGWSMV